MTDTPRPTDRERLPDLLGDVIEELQDIRSALASSPAPAGLDVERLARALAHERAGVRTSWEGWLQAARDLAAEYDRAATRPAEDAP